MLGREYVKTMIQLATSGFGLVAALAWNNAIQALFKQIFGEAGNIISLFGYAVVITVVIVFVTTRLAKLAERVEKQSPDKSASGKTADKG